MGAFLFKGSIDVRLDSLLNGIGRPVAYYPAIAETFGGVKRALWICQFAYWKDKQKDPDGWIHKTEEAITKETGLSRHEQKSVKKWLLEFNLCKIDKRGQPSKNYYLHDWNKLTDEWNKHRTSQPESGPLVSAKAAHQSAGNNGTISTEITTEITSESTKNAVDKSPAPFQILGEQWCEFVKLDIKELTPKDWKAIYQHDKKGADIDQLKALSGAAWKEKKHDLTYLYGIRASLLPKIKPKGEKTFYTPEELFGEGKK